MRSLKYVEKNVGASKSLKAKIGWSFFLIMDT
jgi:hypothetical protein